MLGVSAVKAIKGAAGLDVIATSNWKGVANGQSSVLRRA